MAPLLRGTALALMPSIPAPAYRPVGGTDKIKR
jgi:hypothetical protein